ncbi:hypothetical protein [Dulcicalothrix desertica]|nr:hypothetical protein [Dulcicalothrix desertica]
MPYDYKNWWCVTAILIFSFGYGSLMQLRTLLRYGASESIPSSRNGSN